MCEDGSHKPDAGVVYLLRHCYVELGNGNRVDVQLDRMCSVKRDTHIQNQQSHQRPHTMPYLYTSIKLGTKAIQSPEPEARDCRTIRSEIGRRRHARSTIGEATGL